MDFVGLCYVKPSRRQYTAESSLTVGRVNVQFPCVSLSLSLSLSLIVDVMNAMFAQKAVVCLSMDRAGKRYIHNLRAYNVFNG
jgi:hypothetical protein